jgi:hypothetical protein
MHAVRNFLSAQLSAFLFSKKRSVAFLFLEDMGRHVSTCLPNLPCGKIEPDAPRLGNCETLSRFKAES